MKVKTKVGKSEIAGVGLFADEDIREGTLLWEFDEGFDRVYEELPPAGPALDFIKMYAFMYAGKYVLCVDNARFFNHSDEPNCKSAPSERVGGVTVAARDIRKGEELTDDYRLFGLAPGDVEWNMSI